MQKFPLNKAVYMVDQSNTRKNRSRPRLLLTLKMTGAFLWMEVRTQVRLSQSRKPSSRSKKIKV
jgi:hypothetical protein